MLECWQHELSNVGGLLLISNIDRIDEGGNRMKLWSNSSIPRGNGGFNPERRLLAAVLQRAITDYLTGEGELQSSARDWLFAADDPHEAFCFTYICEALDFHKEELRKAIFRQFDRLSLDAQPLSPQANNDVRQPLSMNDIEDSLAA